MQLPIGEVAPLAPAALDAVLGIATLGMVLIFLVCLGLREGWEHTLGGALRWLANEVRDITLDLGWFGSYHVLGPVADAIEWVADSVSHLLAVAALETENAAASLWHMTGRLFWWTVHETKALSVDLWHALEHTVVVTVPDAAKWAHREAIKVAHRLVNVEAATARAAEAELSHLVHVAEHDAQVGIAVAEHALDWSEAEVGALWRDLDGLKGKLEQLSHRLAPAALVALIGATIFQRFGLGWLRCGNVGKAGKTLCGLETGLVDALLLGTLAVEGRVSLVGMANELVALSGEIVPGVTGFVSELAAVPFRTAAEQGFV